jgi:hypothetical protein
VRDIFTDNFLDAITTDDYENDQQNELINKREILIYLQKQMLKLQHNVVLLAKPTCLTLHAISQDHMKDAKSLISASIKCSSFPVDKKTKPVCKTSNWQDLKTKVLREHPGLVTIKEGADTIDVASTEPIHDDIKKKIERCLNTNALTTIVVPMCSAKVDLLNKNNAELLQHIKDQHKGSMVSFAPIENATIVGITITASQQFLPKIEADFKSLVSRIRSQDFEVEEPWLTRYYSSRDSVREIEMKYEVTCDILSPQGTSQAGR